MVDRRNLAKKPKEANQITELKEICGILNRSNFAEADVLKALTNSRVKGIMGAYVEISLGTSPARKYAGRILQGKTIVKMNFFPNDTYGEETYNDYILRGEAAIEKLTSVRNTEIIKEELTLVEAIAKIAFDHSKSSSVRKAARQLVKRPHRIRNWWEWKKGLRQNLIGAGTTEGIAPVEASNARPPTAATQTERSSWELAEKVPLPEPVKPTEKHRSNDNGTSSAEVSNEDEHNEL